jgi:hypothetical protein
MPSHKAWLLCNMRNGRNFSNLGFALSPTEQETFFDTAH